jgi:hypothetical protein
MKRHELFTADEWREIDRVTDRWSNAGRAKDELLESRVPIDGKKLQAAFAELSAAAEEYHKSIAGILSALRARAPGRGDG